MCSREMYIGHDDCGNIAIKAYDRENGKFYGAKWHGAIRFIGYSRKEAEKRFREMFNLKGKHFEHYDTGFMY